MTHTLRQTTALALALLFAACTHHEIRRFPLAEPMTLDPDRQPVAERPDEYYSGLAWDGIDQIVFRPTNRFLLMDWRGPAANVNAMDEVPDSSWFVNRIGAEPMSDDALARGACPDDRLDTAGPWTVTDAKPNGANPGFIIRDADGRGWLLKFDGLDQPERATTADVFGSRVYHAAGYWSPCNIIVHFDAEILEIADDAEAENARGEDVPMAEHHIQTVLDAAVRTDDGLLRASASLFVDGRPIGPWRYQGRRRDDPNDVIRHEDRRELRGGSLLAAWLNHFDAREQNTLSTWIDHGDGTGHVRHYYIDFGDCLGSRWEQDGLSRRFGNSYYVDPADIFVDFITFGSVMRPWETREVSTVAPILGYFDAEHFDPVNWKPGYPNPSFAAMKDDDGAWMARIIARMGESEIRAMLDEGRMSNEVYEEELVRTLLARRQRILDHWLRVRSPLADFAVDETGERVCFTDLAARTGVIDPDTTRYHASMYVSDWSAPAWSRLENPSGAVEPASLCVDLVEDGVRPAADAQGRPDDDPRRYAVLDLEITPEPGVDPLPPARLHFYDLGEAGFRLVGVERPEDARSPAELR